MSDLTNLEYYVLSVAPKKGRISFRALLASIRRAEVLSPAKIRFEQPPEPEPISLTKSDFCELVFTLASGGLLKVLRKVSTSVEMPGNWQPEVASYLEPRYEQTTDFDEGSIGDFHFCRSDVASSLVADPINKHIFGVVKISNHMRPLKINVNNKKRLAPYVLPIFLAGFLFMGAMIVRWYVVDMIDTTGFAFLGGIFLACTVSGFAIGLKGLRRGNKIVRRISVTD